MSLCFHCQGQHSNLKFCSRSCAAKVNNIGKVRNGKSRTHKCHHCGDLTKNVKFCSLTCDRLYKNKTSLQRIHQLFDEGKLVDRRDIRKVLLQRYGDKCSVCNITEWNSKPITFWVDHINGDASNNSPDNLRLICLNCDSQTDTFGGKNWGKGRKSRGMKQYG